ncbi:hypothetical protein [Streptomyces sp. NPDC057428]|uniref:hypothetical protein n=1 Tax=Streptomyces sp. NPDC057428 TaxID=3346129 RepID=UPI003695A128
MDPYDSHHSPGRDRPPLSPTPIYDRLLAEWHAASRGEAGQGPVDAASGPGSGTPRRRQDAAFVPAARSAG